MPDEQGLKLITDLIDKWLSRREETELACAYVKSGMKDPQTVARLVRKVISELEK